MTNEIFIVVEYDDDYYEIHDEYFLTEEDAKAFLEKNQESRIGAWNERAFVQIKKLTPK